MFLNASKLSAPIAGAVLLVSAGLASAAVAAPMGGERQLNAPKSELVVQIDHRRGHGPKRGGWHGGHGRGHHLMGPRQIRRSLRHRGFHRIHIVDRRGPMYIVRANGRRGMQMRLVVDSRTADIVRSRPIGRQFPRHYRW